MYLAYRVVKSLSMMCGQDQQSMPSSPYTLATSLQNFKVTASVLFISLFLIFPGCAAFT